MKRRKIAIGELGLACWLSMSGLVTTGCTAADTISVAIRQGPTGGSSGGASSGTAGAANGGDGGSTGTGGISTGAGGNANPSTGGAAGVGIDMTTDAAAAGGPADAASEMAATATCPNPMACLKAALVHRYSFNGTGTVATDTVGTANGTVMNAQLSGSGDIVLAGGMPAPYVNLPNGIIKSLTTATLEVWVTWSGGASWQRVFDFGSSDGGENMPGSATTTLYLTPQGGNSNVLLAGFKRMDQSFDVEARAQSPLPLSTGTKVHVAVVVDPAQMLMTLYRNGVVDGTVPLMSALSDLNDINNWLGRSQYGGDAAFTGTLHEFRIYNAALSAAVVQASFTAGADATF